MRLFSFMKNLRQKLVSLNRGGVCFVPGSGGIMNPMMYMSVATITLFFFAAAMSSLGALGKAGADPGAPAGGGDFVAGNAAVAADVNKQINILYKALNDGTNSINIDSWTNSTGNLGYTGGNFGIGLAPTASTRLTVHGAKNTLHQLIGDSASATGAPNTDVFASMAFYGNGIKHAQVHFRPTLGNGTLVFGGSTSAANVVNVGQSLDIALSPNGGNVGIGTASPLSTFHVNVTAPTQAVFGSNLADALRIYPGTEPALIWDSSTNLRLGTMTAINAGFSEKLRILTNGNVGIGNAAPGATLDVTGTIRGSSDISTTGGDVQVDKAAGTFRLLRLLTGGVTRWTFGASSTAESGSNAGSDFVIRRNDDSGTIIGTNAFVIFRSTGIVRIPSLGSGTVSSDASGNLSSASDRRLKDIVGESGAGLNALLGLRGKQWRWKKDSGMDTQGIYEGFIAQDVEGIVPAAVGLNERGYKTLAYHSLLPMFANAIRELKSEKDTQVIALEKRATQAEQRYAAGLQQAQSDREVANRDKAAADARIAALEKRLNSELLARQQQDIRLAKLEQALQRQVVARR